MSEEQSQISDGIRERIEFLASSGDILSRSLDFQTTIQHVSSLILPKLASLFTLDLIGTDGAVSRDVFHADTVSSEFAEFLRPRTPTIPGEGFVARVLTQGEPLFLPDLPSSSPQSSLVGPAYKMGARSLIIAPLVARGRTHGAIGMVRFESEPRYQNDDFKLLVAFCHRVALALDNALLFQQAERAIRDRQDLLAVVSHDLKNPLHAIKLKTNLLMKFLPLDESLDPIRKQAEGILQSSNRMERLIQDLLDLSRIEEGHLKIDKQPVCFTKLIEESADMLIPLAIEKGLELQSELSEGGTPVECDRERIEQVLSNLLGNAIKFTSPGGKIRIRCRQASDGVQVEVADTGCGIKAEDMPHIFDRYWQARKTARYGTGLGLAIAKGIVEAHGGKIWAESTPGHGSRFTFRLPCPSLTPR